MGTVQCPGQDKRFWKAEDIFDAPCSSCGARIEFWKDDVSRKCKGCGATVRNPRLDLGCAAWCKFAQECLGVAAPVSSESLCAALIQKMKEVFGDDQRRIRHALQVLEFAEKLLETERADPLVVKAAAILHDIGILEAEKKRGSSAGQYQEIEGPPIARKIFDEMAVGPQHADHICRIIANHHSARDIDTAEFRIIWDADNLVNLEAELRGKSGEELERFVAERFRTPGGRALALSKGILTGANREGRR